MSYSKMKELENRLKEESSENYYLQQEVGGLQTRCFGLEDELKALKKAYKEMVTVKDKEIDEIRSRYSKIVDRLTSTIEKMQSAEERRGCCVDTSRVNRYDEAIHRLFEAGACDVDLLAVKNNPFHLNCRMSINGGYYGASVTFDEDEDLNSYVTKLIVQMQIMRHDVLGHSEEE